MYSWFKKGIWNGLWSRRKDSPDTKKSDNFFPLSPFSTSFDSNAIEGPVLCHELTHGYEHLLVNQHLTEFPSLGKARETREHTTAEGGSDPVLPDTQKKLRKLRLFSLDD